MIEVKNLKKIFKQKNKEIIAVGGVSFTIQQGETVALIGPNGAGKSTTIKMLTGILHPSEGVVSVLGLSPVKDRKKVVGQIGAVFGQRSNLLPNLPPEDTLKTFWGHVWSFKKSD